MYLIFKTIISAIIIVIVSEIAKKSSFLAAIIVSIPLTSLLAFIWLYWDTRDSQKVIDLSYGTIIMTIPSFTFFIIFPLMIKLKQNFFFSLIISIISTSIIYLIFIYILKKLDLPTEEVISHLQEQVSISTDDEIPDEEEPTNDLDSQPAEEEPPGEKNNDDNLTQKPGGSSEYDELIKRKLGIDTIPISKNSYKFTKGTFEEQVKGDDLKVWQDLWEAKPEKKTEKGVETAGVGKGELSLYWLYNY